MSSAVSVMAGIPKTSVTTEGQQTATNASKRSDRAAKKPGLLTIAQELRDHIYDYLLVDEDGVVNCPVRKFGDRKNHEPTMKNYLALSTTCHQLNQEARAHFSARNILAVHQCYAPDDYLAPLLCIAGAISHLAFWRHVAVALSDGVSWYFSVLDLKINGSSVGYCVRTAGGERAFMARDFYKATPGRVGAAEIVRKHTEAVVRPAVEELRSALRRTGKLELSMLNRLRKFLDPSIAKAPAGLLTIPQELRDQILDNLVVEHTFILELLMHGGAISERKRQDYTALSMTCQQLRRETRSLFFERNIIMVWVTKDGPGGVGPLGAAMEHIRHLTLSSFVCIDLREDKTPMHGGPTCVLDLAIHGASVQHTIRLAARFHDTLEKSFYGRNASDPVWTDSTKGLVEEVTKPCVEDLRAALSEKGKLELGMLQKLYSALQNAWAGRQEG
ncbi:hypothetical protein LTR36_007699 [Oleoguttula mirabilis]|uniref:Uncharacterized protein n=1 Tax=Oleoguttula mirabilis TaxID=1507867 RepID=A0AAV9JU52_9PEZI|nr:hypothetical protein LTR36_007699 [Oleoguttula mirabilis]